MSSKSRRAAARHAQLSGRRKKKQARRPPRIPVASVPTAPEPTQRAEATTTARPTPTVRERVVAYTNIIPELKRIAVISGVLVVVLVVISVVLR